MEEQRRLGLCFNYNEKFGRGHNRVCQRIFLLDLTEDDEAEDVQEVDTVVATEDVNPHICTQSRASALERLCRCASS